MNQFKYFFIAVIFFSLVIPVNAQIVVNGHNNFIGFSISNPGSFTGSPLMILSYGWGGISIPGSTESSIDPLFDLELAPEVTRPALFYPSPFKLKEGSTLGYQLNQRLDMQLRIYDMRGNEIYRKHFSSLEQGGLKGYNYIKFNSGTSEGYQLPENMPSGVYFYVLINDGNVMGKGKFAILP